MHAVDRLMSEEEIRDLPPVIDVPTAARAFGVGRSAAYEMIRTNTWPTPVLRLGRLIRIPRSAVFELLGIGTTSTGEAEPE